MPLSYTTVLLATPEGPQPFAMSDAEALALNYAPPLLRNRFGALFAMEARLRRYVAASREPLLTQIKIAWWREQISRSPESEHEPEPLLGVLRSHWNEDLDVLADYVGSYELLLADKPLRFADSTPFSEQAGKVYASFGHIAEMSQFAEAANRAGRIWATAWLMDNRYLRRDEPALLPLTHGTPGDLPRLPPALRSIAVLRALGRRALVGGVGLLEGRLSAIVALKAGLLGR